MLPYFIQMGDPSGYLDNLVQGSLEPLRNHHIYIRRILLREIRFRTPEPETASMQEGWNRIEPRRTDRAHPADIGVPVQVHPAIIGRERRISIPFRRHQPRIISRQDDRFPGAIQPEQIQMALSKEESAGAELHPDRIRFRQRIRELLREGIELRLRPYRNHFRDGGGEDEEQMGGHHRARDL